MKTSPVVHRCLGVLGWLAVMAVDVQAQSVALWTDSTGLLEQRDWTTFDVLSAATCSGWLQGCGNGFDGARLWSLSSVSNPRLCCFNPAGGAVTTVGPTGLPWAGNPHGIDTDPQSGDIWLAGWSGTGVGTNLYRIDKQTGLATVAGSLSGLLPFDGIEAMAIESPNRVFGIGFTSPNPPRAALYEFDLTSFAAVLLGVIQMPFYGDFCDVALLPSGDLIAIYRRVSSGATPLYRINTQTATATFALSSPGGSGFTGIAIGPGTVMLTYCTAKTNSVGCAPTIFGLGFASVAAVSGFVVTAEDVLNQRMGSLLWTAGATASTPFAGGTLCVASPFVRTMPVSSGGSALPTVDCSGAWSRDMNTYLHAHTSLPAGTTLHCQWVGRDPGFAPPNNYQLSNALTFTLKP